MSTKESVLKKIYNHPDRDEIISKLTLGVTADEVSNWLSDKYEVVGDKKLIFSTRVLKKFKDEDLDIYKQIRDDCLVIRQEQDNAIKDMQTAVQNNSAYRSKLNAYIDKEIDIKMMVKNMILVIEERAMQVFDKMQSNPDNTKLDYVLINWFNTLTAILERYDLIINGSPDKIIQQNNINIQILDQHVHVFQKVIREVISRLDYETSLMFIDILNDELLKIKPAGGENIMPIDLRLAETRKLEEKVNQLDMPTV